MRPGSFAAALRLPAWAACVAVAAFASSCAGAPAPSGEELYELGTAYYELGKLERAEYWFSKARGSDRTRAAADYELARLAFDAGRFEEAARGFEALLDSDPQNARVLKASAFSRLKAGDAEAALAHYAKVAELLPGSDDARYNYALLLRDAKEPGQARAILEPLIRDKPGDAAARLLLARAGKDLGLVEAIDEYEAALAAADDPTGRRELAEALEGAGFFARAAEAYDAILKAGKAEAAGVGKGEVRFAKARLLLLAGGEADGAPAELLKAVEEGFADRAALDALAADEKIAADPTLAKAVAAAVEALDKAQAAAAAAKDAAASQESAASTEAAASSNAQEKGTAAP